MYFDCTNCFLVERLEGTSLEEVRNVYDTQRVTKVRFVCTKLKHCFFVAVYRIWSCCYAGTSPSKCAILSFTIEGTHPYDLGMILDKQGIAIRTGQHCAEPVMKHYGVSGMCRASIGLYNTSEEIEKLEAGLKRAVRMLR